MALLVLFLLAMPAIPYFGVWIAALKKTSADPKTLSAPKWLPPAARSRL